MFKFLKLQCKVIALQLENDNLKDSIKDELFTTFMDKLGESQELNRLRKENKRLRLQVRELKKLLKEEINNDHTR